MMGKTKCQLRMIVLDTESLIPEKHLLRKIKNEIDFSFIYEKAAPYYSTKGRKSIDPVVLIKMLLIGYIYGIKSERRLEEEVCFNIAYRWFCDIDFTQKVPDHSTFSQNRKRRFHDSMIFREIFNEIVMQCIEKGFVTGKTVVSDGSFLPANVSYQSTQEKIEKVNQTAIQYLDELEMEMSKQPGYQKPCVVEVEKRMLVSKTDPDCRYINQRKKSGIGYLTEMSIDTSHGIITGVDCYPANHRESDIILNHLKYQKENLSIDIKKIALDAGYDIGAVHRGLELLGIDGYTAIRIYQNNALKKGFTYDPEKDAFICSMQQHLTFQRLVFKKTSLNYYRLYSCPRKYCEKCPRIKECEIDKGSIRISASGNYPAFHRNKQKYETPEYFRVMRLRKIWAEGTFAVLKREHKLKRIQKRGIFRALEECLLSAMALNLKRLVKATK